MKNRILWLFLLSIFCACSPKKQADDSNVKFMSIEDAQKRWGQSVFTKETFKNGTTKARAVMAVDLIRSGKYIGAPVGQVKSDLGEYTGYYWNHNIPAYLVEEGIIPKGELKMHGDTWQIVLLPDKNGNIKEIKII